MILSVFVIIIVGLIAYMHYLGGLLSGLISAVMALIAAAMAMSYYESLAETLSGGKFNDTAQGICLLAIFAIVYLLGRVLFDMFVPGNVRVPHLVDKIGGAVMGILSGMIAMGLVAIALQSMPFSPSVAGYARYPMASESERSLPITPIQGQRGMDRIIYDQIKNNDLEKESQGLLLPVDDFVLGLTKRLSGAGSLSTGKPFESVHPDLLQELFAQRLGIEAGAKHTASNSKGTQVTVEQINLLPSPIPRMLGDFPELWPDQPPKEKTLAAGPNRRLISVTVMFHKDAADEGAIVRLSTGSIRLVIPPKPGEEDEWKNSFPIATEQVGQAWTSRIDDFMFINLQEEDRGAHFIFEVDGSAFEQQGSAKVPAGGKATPVTYTIRPGSFIEVKRLAKLSLEDVKIVDGMPPEEKKYYPMRKTKFFDEKTLALVTPTPTTPTPTTPTPPIPDTSRNPTPTTPTPTTPTPTTPTPTTVVPDPAHNGWAEAPLTDVTGVESSNTLLVGVGIGPAADVTDVLAAGASGHLTAKRFDTLEVDPSNSAAAIDELPNTGNAIQELSVPAGKRMLKVTLNVRAGPDTWVWAPKLASFTVVDAAGTSYKPSGVMALAQAGSVPRLLAIYKSVGEVTVKKVAKVTLSSVTLIYLVPTEQKVPEIRYEGKPGGLPVEK